MECPFNCWVNLYCLYIHKNVIVFTQITKPELIIKNDVLVHEENYSVHRHLVHICREKKKSDDFNLELIVYILAIFHTYS